MTWRRSRINTQTIRTLRRMREQMQRTEDDRIAQLTARTSVPTGGVR